MHNLRTLYRLGLHHINCACSLKLQSLITGKLLTGEVHAQLNNGVIVLSLLHGTSWTINAGAHREIWAKYAGVLLLQIHQWIGGGSFDAFTCMQKTRARTHREWTAHICIYVCAGIILYNSAVISQQSFSLFHLVFCGSWRKRKEKERKSARREICKEAQRLKGNEKKRMINMRRESRGRVKKTTFYYFLNVKKIWFKIFWLFEIENLYLRVWGFNADYNFQVPFKRA